MKLENKQYSIEAYDIKKLASDKKEQKARYVQILAIHIDGNIELVYTFMQNNELQDYHVCGLKKGDSIDSISNIFKESFVCENEIHDLFGISFKNLVIDFHGNFYAVSQETPMTIISPEELKRREKEAKIAAALAAKEKKKTQEEAKENQSLNNDDMDKEDK